MAYLTPMEYWNRYDTYPRNSYVGSRSMESKITVQGQGRVMVQPNIAVATIGVVTENEKLKIAQEENAVKTNAVIDVLTKMGIREKDMKTETYSITPQYDYIEGKQIFRGYKVTNSLNVTIEDIGMVGRVIDKAVEQGANLVSNINFTIADPSLQYRKAVRRAIEDGVQKAKEIENTLAIRMNPTPVSVSEESVQYQPFMQTTSMKYYDGAAATPIKEGQIEIKASVKMAFNYVQI